MHRHAGLNIDAVQLEFGRPLRTKQRGETAEIIASAVHSYLQPLVPFMQELGTAVGTQCRQRTLVGMH